jgi:hypothetical protein
MNLTTISSRIGNTVRALLQRHGSFSNLPAEAKALFRKHQSKDAEGRVPREVPGSAAFVSPPALAAPEVTLAGAVRMLGFGAAEPPPPTLTAFRDQVRARISARTSDKIAELGFPGAVPALSARADSELAVHDSPAARLAVLAAELGCGVDDLRKEHGEATRQRIEARVAELAMTGVAGLGIAASALPPCVGDSMAGGDELEEIQQQLGSERDPVKAGQLAAKANALRDRKWSNLPARGSTS